MGIEAEYRDARGAIRKISRKTQEALLAAMGVEAHDEAEAKTALDALDRESWLRPLPPVQVIYADRGPVSVEVTLPAEIDEMVWRLELEAGGERNGKAQLKQLPVIERHKIDGHQFERRRLVLGDLPWGYHRLELEPDGAMTLIVTPGNCWLPAPIGDGQQLWGVAAQLYLLRSARNWGIGDYSDLARLTELLSAQGADIVGVNPLHALFIDAPEQASPYSPASRLLLNILNIDVVAIPELAECPPAQALMQTPEFQDRLEHCRAALLVDYSTVAALKIPVLRLIFATSLANPDNPRWRAFEAFRAAQGTVLEQGCRFFALRQRFGDLDGSNSDWHAWPEAYQDPSSPEVERFAMENADLVTFHAWLQWLADSQLAAAATAAAGMAVGLYRDLAVGADRSGAETWSCRLAVVDDAQVGAPPDILNPAGQGWGLPPFHPKALREEAYRSFIDLLRANMRHAGGLRIDHVMALQHLYWIPRGQSPANGAYVQYDLEDLVGILALESQRHRCLVIGEDLGTVPASFRERMQEAAILSYRVLLFEQDGTHFIPPDNYPKLALAVSGSHDLATLRGWWAGDDIGRATELGHFRGKGAVKRERQNRETEKRMLLAALIGDAQLPGQDVTDLDLVIQAIHGYLGHSAAALAMAQIDDLTRETHPVNLPGTTTEYPNWRRRLSVALEDLEERSTLNAVAAAFNATRRPAKIDDPA